MRVTFPETGEATGEVVSGSRLGDAEFCVGTRFRDRQGGGAWLIERTLRCSKGQITLGFNPDTGSGDGTQIGKWGIVGGTGRYSGLEGSGRFTVDYPFQRGSDAKGRETFAGTVAR